MSETVTSGTDVIERVATYCETNGIRGKGNLAVVLHITRLARERGLPLDVTQLRANSQGQVAGLGRGRVQRILSEHGIARELAREGGRTSRGSLGLAETYASFLNQLTTQGLIGGTEAERQEALLTIEDLLVQRVREYFNAKHMTINSDMSNTVSYVIADVLAQARERQREMPGSTVEGAVLQHLIGAKLAVRLGDDVIEHQSYSTADVPTSRGGDFDIRTNSISIHVTTSPTERLIEKCKANIEAGRRPIIIVPDHRISATETRAENAGLKNRVEVLGAERFISGNIAELSIVNARTISDQVREIVDMYNRIVTSRESDPSLQIDYA